MGDGFGLKWALALPTMFANETSVTLSGDTRVLTRRYVDAPTAFSRIALRLSSESMSLAVK
jgi:hypothetical protein